MLVREIKSQNSKQLAKKLKETFTVTRNAGVLSLADIASRIKDGVLTDVHECTLGSNGKLARFYFPVDSVRVVSLANCRILDYFNWPKAERLRLFNTKFENGLGKYISEKVDEVEIEECVIPLSEFDVILGSGKQFEIKRGDCQLTYWGSDYDVTFDGWETGAVFRDVFDFQEYLMSDDNWKKFFSQ
ncbi:hypothetical protein RsoM2USA_284 [Ralstonia phage RsoM2USA]|nr:hypothetical protein RsoM2USA_284 [Ralstonia phage RsoM2USA]